MKPIIYLLVITGLLLSCSKKKSERKDLELDTNAVIKEKQPEETVLNYREIVLYENSLDSFTLPFPERSMLLPLRQYYNSYSVEAKIGEQDGPDFVYFEILRSESPVIFLSFNYKNEYQLEEIIIEDSTALDQYGVRVGDTYSELKQKRNVDFENVTNYHVHTYLYTDNSNIYYEISGNLTEAGPDNLEDLVLTEQQLESWVVDKIIWRINYQ